MQTLEQQIFNELPAGRKNMTSVKEITIKQQDKSTIWFDVVVLKKYTEKATVSLTKTGKVKKNSYKDEPLSWTM